jgi:hypothetical protein
MLSGAAAGSGWQSMARSECRTPPPCDKLTRIQEQIAQQSVALQATKQELSQISLQSQGYDYDVEPGVRPQ